jgi:ADP-dependent NAD(P)H-hydrate dehydratase / NAD(P)H-hydrate epimerase
MRRLDAHAIEVIGIPGIVLMENAARAMLEAIEERLGDVELLSIAVVCGPGNNGGDGFALARHLFLRGAEVDVYLLPAEDSLKGDALTNYQLLGRLGLHAIEWSAEDEGITLTDYDLIVDAIFGTGAARAPSGVYAQAIEAINDSPADVYAVDLPSGVDATTGEAPGLAVEADVTITFQQAKCGLLLPPGRDLAGDLIVAPISIPDHEQIIAAAPFWLPEDADVELQLPARPRDAHKGLFGNLLIVAGSRGMSGAARLMGLAALRSGVGLVKVACPESIRFEVAAFRPEVMTIALPETAAGAIAANALDTLKSYIEWADVIAIGPGLGTDEETAKFLTALFNFAKLPYVIDADALNLIAAHNLLASLPTEDVILTPHPGEFDRLTGQKYTDFPSRVAAGRTFAQEHGVYLLLKGAPSISFDPDGLGVLNPTGNPGLATAGTGDVLTGIVGALRAQGLDSHSASWMAAYLHGRAADLAIEEVGMASLVAGDVISYLPAAFASVAEEAGEEGEAEHEHGCNGHHA